MVATAIFPFFGFLCCKNCNMGAELPRQSVTPAAADAMPPPLSSPPLPVDFILYVQGPLHSCIAGQFFSVNTSVLAYIYSVC